MFNCRVCSNTPFGHFFGVNERGMGEIFGDSDDEGLAVEKKPPNYSAGTSEAAPYDTTADVVPATNSERERFEPRSPEEVLVTCKAWRNYMHPRARNYWQNSEKLDEVLALIAQGVDQLSDPLLGNERHCVFWHEALHPEDNLPVVWAVRPNESQESLIYVIRVLVFFFCDDASFEELHQKKKFELLCEEPTCVNLSHIALD